MEGRRAFAMRIQICTSGSGGKCDGGSYRLSDFMVAVTVVEAGYATSAEWRDFISRHAGFFDYDPESGAYCMITVPAPWRDTPGPIWQLVAAMMWNQRRQLSVQPSPRPVQERLQLL